MHREHGLTISVYACTAPANTRQLSLRSGNGVHNAGNPEGATVREERASWPGLQSHLAVNSRSCKKFRSLVGGKLARQSRDVQARLWLAGGKQGLWPVHNSLCVHNCIDGTASKGRSNTFVPFSPTTENSGLGVDKLFFYRKVLWFYCGFLLSPSFKR